MLTTVGDLVEDLVVSGSLPLAESKSDRRHIELNAASDTSCPIQRRRGGSAANVAAAAGANGAEARFIGQVGADYVGDHLIAELSALGVEVVARRGGTSPAIVVLLHPDGERSMITDRGSSLDLDRPQRAWLDGTTVLHVPLYSLASGALAQTASTLIGWATDLRIPVSLDASATSLLESIGLGPVVDLIGSLRPAYLLANEAEASLLSQAAGPGGLASLATRAVIEKRGSGTARIITEQQTAEVDALELGPIGDSTGAGDAFAAGFLTAVVAGNGLAFAVRVGHRFAATHLRTINAQVPE